MTKLIAIAAAVGIVCLVLGLVAGFASAIFMAWRGYKSSIENIL